MEKHENTHIGETTNDIIVRELTNRDSNSTFVKEYLKAGFVSAAVDQLFYARRQAGLTQAEVAERMDTKQAAIARLEADTKGSLSLRRYAEFALSCGMMPLEITLVPIESARYFVIDNPDLPITQVNYDRWLLTKETPIIPEAQKVETMIIPTPENVQTIEIPQSQFVKATVIPTSQNAQTLIIEGQITSTTHLTTKTFPQNTIEHGNQLQEWRSAA